MKVKIFLLSILIFSSQLALAQAPLKIIKKPKTEVPTCDIGTRSFEIKNATDQAVCNKLRKPDPEGTIEPPRKPVATPNPITPPPTGR